MTGHARAPRAPLPVPELTPPRRTAVGPRPVARPGAFRRLALAITALPLAAGGIATLSIAGARSHHPPPSLSPAAMARTDARAFLQRYVRPDGRVVRTDQGGDTVSEGQAYALLLAVATGDRHRFAPVWQWDQSHLQLPDGLFAYRWQDGAVVSSEPATDADLLTAWALLLAGEQFGSQTDRAAGLRVAAAVLTDETATVAGRLELVAGPWARGAPAVVNPSYLATGAMQWLATATGDHRWSALAADSQLLLAQLGAGQPPSLPPDWLQLPDAGLPLPSATPGGGQPPTYGLDAQRTLVWEMTGCNVGEAATAARDWPILERAASEGGRISYTTTGKATSTYVNPLGWVAAAAAAQAAGRPAAAASLLDRADAQQRRHPTYYGGAWVALGRVLLDTPWLPACGSGG